MIDRRTFIRKVKMAALFVVIFMVASIGQAEEKGSLGNVVDIIAKELPYYKKSGEFLGVIKEINRKDFVGKAVLEEAPKGLIGLEIGGELKYFRAVNFTISGGTIIDCPEVLQSKSSSTKEPVVSGLGNKDCAQEKS